MASRHRAIMFLLILCFGFVASIEAIEPPNAGGSLPEAYFERLSKHPGSLRFKGGLLRLTATAREGREKIKNGAQPLGLIKSVQGNKKILVLLARFNDSVDAAYGPEKLASKLFGKDKDGPLPGTLSAYYKDNSYGKLVVDGSVAPWKTLSHSASYYAGAPAVGGKPCYGLCENSHVAELVEEAIKQNDGSQAWQAYDNDGPDDVSNSRDDDGKVDFLVIVHPGKGAECTGAPAESLWSHQDLLSNWTGHHPYTTKVKSKSNVQHGGNIQVDDYVLVPAVACDGVTPIQIGVIAHEFGHSLGLPDLYDTSRNPSSEGLGNWDLMAGGSWGGDGKSPEVPVHLSAWSKAYLGWVRPAPHPQSWPKAIEGQPQDVAGDISPTTLEAYETSGDVYLVTIKSDSHSTLGEMPNVYYLISNRQKKGFDSNLPGSGLLILRVDEGVLASGLANNNVNVDPNHLGVAVVEADGSSSLIHRTADDRFRGGPGDTFPGSSKQVNFDNSTKIKTEGSVALCGISEAGDSVSFSLFVSKGLCDGGASLN